jgi:hypothetical protein
VLEKDLRRTWYYVRGQNSKLSTSKGAGEGSEEGLGPRLFERSFILSLCNKLIKISPVGKNGAPSFNMQQQYAS